MGRYGMDGMGGYHHPFAFGFGAVTGVGVGFWLWLWPCLFCHNFGMELGMGVWEYGGMGRWDGGLAQGKKNSLGRNLP